MDALLELADLPDGFAQRQAEQAGQAGIDILEEGPNMRPDMMRYRSG
jgi:hypothetical protein